jgi:predicted ATPase
LVPTSDNRLVFADERVKFHGDHADVDWSIGTGQNESNLKASSGEQGKREQQICSYIYEAISSWVVYHFHDTSHTAALRRKCSVRDGRKLRSDGSNLAAFLFFLKTHDAHRFDLICESVRLVTPFFDSFRLLPNREESGDETVELEWLQKGSDYPFHPSQLSDGTIRFIALTTALLQPHLPSTVLIDEPELGLHPYALDVLANLILQAKERTQIIVSTQSAPLLNAFEPDQIVVMDRVEGESRMRRLESTSLESWLDQEYTLGELWQKNVYGGVPAYE